MPAIYTLRRNLSLVACSCLHIKPPKMRTTTKIVLVIFVIVSTLLYCVLNEEHDKYTAEANSGDPHHMHQKEGKTKEDPDGKETKKCVGEDCPPEKKLKTIEEYMKENPLSEEQMRHAVEMLRSEMNEYADLPPYEDLKKEWDARRKEKEREILQEEARKKRDEKKKEEQEKKEPEDQEETVEQVDDTTIHLAVVACGDRLEETLIMLKSATIFTKAPLKFHIFTDDDLKGEFMKQLTSWPEMAKKKFTFELYPISFPGVDNPDMWIKFFKPCACQRIFLPYILTDVEKLLYVDTDILFFIPLDDIWHYFTKFNSTQISAVTPEHEATWMGWYNRFARHPYYGEMGVNSGVMLMNLRLMRESRWLPLMVEYFSIYRLNMTWGDQDLINVFFHNYPEKLYVYPCEWNFRPDHCMYGLVCKTAEQEGVRVVHGNRGVYHNEKQPVFKAIYHIMKQYMWGGDPHTGLLQPIESKFQDAELLDTYCGKSSHVLVKGLRRTINEFNEFNKTKR